VIVDGACHQLNQPVAKRNPGEKSERGAERANQQALAQDQRKQFATRDAERPQQPKQAPALQHREGHGVVDQEHADQQRKQAHGSEVDAKRARHLGKRLTACGRRHNLDRCRQRCAYARKHARPPGPVRQCEVDP